MPTPGNCVRNAAPVSCQQRVFNLSQFDTDDYINKDNMLSNEVFNLNDRKYSILEPELKAKVHPSSDMAQVEAPVKESQDTSVMKMILSSKTTFNKCTFVLKSWKRVSNTSN